MARTVEVRNISGEDRLVGYGLPKGRLVEADEVISVPAEVEESYTIQTSVWEKTSPDDPDDDVDDDDVDDSTETED
jgi:hypothetical protein